ncbi:hypothetical protein N0A02_07100 [Paraburkholderia acidicola]|uniref:Methyltransferase FkbM domain-containing protein n=1 Tax=Paraburkholderia acidicola TaxID=1912599 RepID=A0ABV1LIU4_9BURK
MDVDEALNIIGILSSNGVEARRLYLANRLMDITGGVIQHGPMRGYNLGELATWRVADNSAKILGLYEQEICELLAELGKTRHTLIDLGAADGFYGVGMVASGCYQRSHCFEIVDESRDNIRKIAASAGVGERVHLHGAATENFMAELQAYHVALADSVVLCDIETHEFDVFTEECLKSLSDAHIIIEIHDFMIADGKAKYEGLLSRAGQHFEIREIKTGARDLSTIPILSDHWTDSDRWLLCSESRAKLMSWLYLRPRS